MRVATKALARVSRGSTGQLRDDRFIRRVVRLNDAALSGESDSNPNGRLRIDSAQPVAVLTTSPVPVELSPRMPVHRAGLTGERAGSDLGQAGLCGGHRLASSRALERNSLSL
jgi:hypothetical protein